MMAYLKAYIPESHAKELPPLVYTGDLVSSEVLLNRGMREITGMAPEGPSDLTLTIRGFYTQGGEHSWATYLGPIPVRVTVEAIVPEKNDD